MKKIYHLSTCDSCKRIIKAVKPGEEVELQDIKNENIDEQTLDLIKSKIGSYEALFSKRAQKFRSMGLHEKELTEKDYRSLILSEYTFLKRPFIIHNDDVFIGNSKETTEKAVKAFNS